MRLCNFSGSLDDVVGDSKIILMAYQLNEKSKTYVRGLLLKTCSRNKEKMCQIGLYLSVY